MSYTIDDEGIRNAGLGILVHRDAATLADGDLFSVDGGRVLLVGLVGRVTVEIGAGSEDIELDFDPDLAGASTVALTTTLLIDGDVVGTQYVLPATLGGAALTEVAPGNFSQAARLAAPALLVPGDIVLDVTGAEAGEIEWDLLYVPIDDGASVTAV